MVFVGPDQSVALQCSIWSVTDEPPCLLVVSITSQGGAETRIASQVAKRDQKRDEKAPHESDVALNDPSAGWAEATRDQQFRCAKGRT